MKNFTFIIVLLILGLTNVSAQTQNDSITVKKVFGGYQFSQGEQRLNMQQLVKTLKPNEEAYKQIKSARSNQTIGMIFGAAGGFMIGYPLGTALGGGEPKWIMAGIGAGLVAISIPFSSKANKKAKQAVKTYNQGLKNKKVSSVWDKSELNFSMTPNGIGLIFHF